MSIDTVTLFFALLAIALQVALVVVVVGASVPLARREIVNALGPVALILAAMVATGAMLGSLYLSEIAKFTPCKLCWYQRIAMYPSAVLLLVAAIRGDGTVRRHVVPLASIGAVISSYHILLERFPNLESGTCDPTNPCSLIWFEKFGYITIPVMALTAFATVVALLAIHRSWSRSVRPFTQESI
jgi:disulfide bond formation protein DsbB